MIKNISTLPSRNSQSSRRDEMHTHATKTQDRKKEERSSIFFKPQIAAHLQVRESM